MAPHLPCGARLELLFGLFMVFSARTASQLLPDYDAVVIGSGYGGGVASSRLARMGFRVAVLEQGRLLRPGDFPTTSKARRREMRLTGRAPKIGDPAGLYYLSVGKGLTVFGASDGPGPRAVRQVRRDAQSGRCSRRST